MNNKEFINKVKPLIFEKKLNNKTKFILLNNKQNTLAPTKYFPPATQEWYNSLYAYNNLYTKNITIADKNFSRLIKSYFNLYFSKNILSGKRVLAKVKRTSINKIFISKADVKHTASKVVITLYVYNEERRTLLNRLRSLETVLFPSIKFTSLKNKESKKLSLQDKINIINKEENLSINNSLLVIKNRLQDEIRYNKDVLETIKEPEVKVEKLLKIKDLDRKLKNILTIAKFSENDSAYNKNYTSIYDKFINKIILEKEIISLAYYKLLLSLNKYKFEDKLLLKLKPLIIKIYGKNVEFNIINLKAIYLNSDIFTQVISLKLTNRDNPLLRVLKRFLRLAKLPKFNLLSERYAYTNIKELWINKVKNLTLNYLGPNTKKDNINQLLIGLFNDSNFSKKSPLLKSSINNENKTSYSINLINYVLESLKHKNMAGVRLEAKGRLTRRLTASRSVFKIKWKGSLKNIYSTYRGLPSVMLRGHAKSNVSYSIANSKTRNGAFGLKGWISGK